MRIGELEIPSTLIDYHKRGKLVVFTGAGISMPPPSNLPNFLGLTELIAREKEITLTQDDKSHLDRFLGKQEQDGFAVREHTRRILTNPDSKPTQWHEYILRLFVESKIPIRIVTTNFDNHQCSEAQSRSIECERYYAPALPLGNEFEGIVYLHGHINRNLRDIVLTGDDFGRAYITKAWATRFLQDMFSEYAVLFIGYSYDDPLMYYLARGLCFPETGLFPFAVRDKVCVSGYSWCFGIPLHPEFFIVSCSKTVDESELNSLRKTPNLFMGHSVGTSKNAHRVIVPKALVELNGKDKMKDMIVKWQSLADDHVKIINKLRDNVITMWEMSGIPLCPIPGNLGSVLRPMSLTQRSTTV